MKEKSSFIKRFVGNKAFYAAVLAIALPVMAQNGITQFVGVLDNLMVGRIGTEQMSGVAIANQLIFVLISAYSEVCPGQVFSARSSRGKEIMTVFVMSFASSSLSASSFAVCPLLC